MELRFRVFELMENVFAKYGALLRLEGRAADTSIPSWNHRCFL